MARKRGKRLGAQGRAMARGVGGLRPVRRSSASASTARGTGLETGDYALPPQYQFDMPEFPEISTPDYKAQAQGDVRLASQLFNNEIASAQRQLQTGTDANLARAADVWDRYQKSIAPIGPTLQGANSAIMSQMGNTLNSVYGGMPSGGGVGNEAQLGQAAAAAGGTGQMGLLANMAAAQQGMQAGYQREGAVDATDLARKILNANQDQLTELSNQAADFAKTLPDQFLSRLADLRSQGLSDAMARFRLGMEWQDQLSQKASDAAWRELLASQATRTAAKPLAAKPPTKPVVKARTKPPAPTGSGYGYGYNQGQRIIK